MSLSVGILPAGAHVVDSSTQGKPGLLGGALSDIQAFSANAAAFQPTITAAAAGLMGAAFLDLDGMEALEFGSVVAVAAAAMDGILMATGKDKKLDAMGFFSQAGDYLDPTDFVGGALGAGLLFYLAGVRSERLAYSALIGAVASGVAPQVSRQVIAKVMQMRAKAALKSTHAERATSRD